MKNQFCLFWGVALALCVMSGKVFSEGSLQVLPTRIVLSSESSTELTLINKGSDKGVFRILLRNIRTDDHGAFSIAENTEEGDLFANKLIRYSPRRVT